MTGKPVLILDVDGVIVGGREKPREWDRWCYVELSPPSWPADEEGPLPIWYSPDLVEWINKTSKVADIIWLTSWEDEADTHLAPALGLPRGLPNGWNLAGVVPEWKTRRTLIDLKVTAYMNLTHPGTPGKARGVLAGRPMVWADDELDRHTRHMLTTRTTPAPLLVRPAEPLGLTPDICARIDAYLDKHTEAA